MALSKLSIINIAGSFLAIGGIVTFFGVKHMVKRQRQEAMRSRQRMNDATKGVYERLPDQSETLKKFLLIMALNPGIQIDPSKMQLVANLEIEMMSDMYNRMASSCHRKCIPPKYHDAELAKGESVCLDRCVAKYLDVHERIGKKLTTMSAQDEEAAKKLEQQLKTT